MSHNKILIDLFSGIGGFPKGFLEAGFKFEHHYYSEINKNSIAVYKDKFKEAEYVGDIRFVSGTGLRKKHPSGRFIVTFGFPCQDLSLAGEKRGLKGSRSGLFFQAIRIINEIRPDIFIFENVKGLLSNNQGKDFETVLKTIADIGVYECEWQLLNTKWVLPQNRERVYFIGHYRGRSKPRVFPFIEADFLSLETTRQTQIASTLTVGGKSGGLCAGINIVDNRYKLNNPYLRSDCPSLSASDSKDPLILQISAINTPDFKIKKQNGQRIKKENEPMFTLTSTGIHGLKIEDEKIQYRRLTEIECERFQGFPDNWTQYGLFENKLKKISKTRRYEMLGNAVSVPVVKLIAEKIL